MQCQFRGQVFRKNGNTVIDKWKTKVRDSPLEPRGFGNHAQAITPIRGATETMEGDLLGITIMDNGDLGDHQHRVWVATHMGANVIGGQAGTTSATQKLKQ
jgi:hypothetical protein